MVHIPPIAVSRKDEITQEFLRLVDRYFDDLLAGRLTKRWHAKEFADALHIHPTHLTNTLKLTIQKSPCDILENRILKECQHLLESTDLSVAEIGYRFAFEDPSNFTKFFKLISGYTPKQYKKLMAA